VSASRLRNYPETVDVNPSSPLPVAVVVFVNALLVRRQRNWTIARKTARQDGVSVVPA